MHVQKPISTRPFFAPPFGLVTSINDNKVRVSTRITAKLVWLMLILETLIVWTELDGVDYALSFQEAEGCAEVWNFIAEVQQHMKASGQP